MPLVWLMKIRPNGRRSVKIGKRAAVLLTEGDRYSVYDPSTDNELVRGMTKHMLDILIKDGYLTYAEQQSE